MTALLALDDLTRRFPGVVNRVGNVVGRKGVRSDRPAERLDARVLETLIDL